MRSGSRLEERASFDCRAGRRPLSRRGHLRTWLAAAAIALLPACESEDRDDGWYTLVLVPESGSDPFGDPDAVYLYLRIEEADLEVRVEQEFLLGQDEYVLDDAPTGRELYFVVEVRDGAVPRGVIARGRSGPHALLRDEHTTVTVILSEVP